MEGCGCQDGTLLQSGSCLRNSVCVDRFDVFNFEFKGPEDESGILQSRDEVNKLIEQEIKDGVPPNRIVVGGFSQGATMTLVVGLTTKHKLAGLTVLSGRLPIREKIKEVRMGNLTLVVERLDTSSVASGTACNYSSHLLGTR